MNRFPVVYGLDSSVHMPQLCSKVCIYSSTMHGDPGSCACTSSLLASHEPVQLMSFFLACS